MKKIVILALGLFLSVNAYKGQEITLDKIYSGYYRGKGIAGISPLKTDDYYAVIEPNRNCKILL